MQNDRLGVTMGVELLNARVSRSSNSWSNDPLQTRSTEIPPGCITLFYFPFNGPLNHMQIMKRVYQTMKLRNNSPILNISDVYPMFMYPAVFIFANFFLN